MIGERDMTVAENGSQESSGGGVDGELVEARERSCGRITGTYCVRSQIRVRVRVRACIVFEFGVGIGAGAGAGAGGVRHHRRLCDCFLCLMLLIDT